MLFAFSNAAFECATYDFYTGNKYNLNYLGFWAVLLFKIAKKD